MTNERMRFGLIGCGRISQTHFDALAEVNEADLRVVVDVREEARGAAAEAQMCAGFADYRAPEVLASVDAVIVCTPPDTHHEVAGYFLSKGKHVLCEKPLTIHTSEAEALVRLAEASAVRLVMASKFRFVSDVIEAKSIIASGALGRIALYENSFCSHVEMQDRWNADPQVAGGGVLIDNGSHAVDIVRYLLGPITAIKVERCVPRQQLEVEDTVRVHVRTCDGAIGAMDLSWSLDKKADDYIRVYGTTGTLAIGWQGSGYWTQGQPQRIEFGAGYDKRSAHQRQLRNFIAAIAGTEPSLILPCAAVASVRAVEAGYASMDGDSWVAVEP